MRLRRQPERVLSKAFVVAALALSACAAPSSYDGLSGSTKEDETLAAPRQISPISVSLVASSRPRLRWELGTTLTGAVVEMARTRDFAKDVKTFVANGSELVVPEDLELGVWFWRLKGGSSGTVGTKTSPVWEMVVRGPAAHGSSDTPTRAMVDMNGDGEPDLIVVGTELVDGKPPGGGDTLDPGTTAQNPPMGGAPATGPVLMLYNGDREAGLVEGDSVFWGPSLYDGPISLGGGTDFDGDGITDLINSGISAGPYLGRMVFDVEMIPGSAADKKLTFDLDRAEFLYLGADATQLPTVREGADVDGDGYGDAVVGVQDTGFLVLGVSSGGHNPFLAVVPAGPAAGSRIAMGGFDANGDGLADVAFSFSDPYEPTARAFAAPGSRTHRVGDEKMIDGPDAQRATAFAAGDFNGDGIDDIAITTPVNDTARICIWFGDRAKLLVQGPCVMAAPGETDFGASLTAGDLEGDGMDELLATAKSGGADGVRVIRIGADGAATAAPIGIPGVGVKLTTIWPGRPGKARWAAVAGDGSAIAIFDGADLRMSLPPPRGVVKGFGRGLR